MQGPDKRAVVMAPDQIHSMRDTLVSRVNILLMSKWYEHFGSSLTTQAKA